MYSLCRQHGLGVSEVATFAERGQKTTALEILQTVL